MDLTIITPIGKSHKEYFEQCAASVQAQTVACRHIYAVDNGGRGPGYIRNKLMGRVTTPYVAFLDADDWLDATFAERTLAKIKPERYVYTGWWQNDKAIKPPKKAWCEGTWHTVTCLVPTSQADLAWHLWHSHR
jgi:cellulose synthase/poly-beta-1,6-N-acetylglucosamine synthase-like glycosyltransferase